MSSRAILCLLSFSIACDQTQDFGGDDGGDAGAHAAEAGTDDAGGLEDAGAETDAGGMDAEVPIDSGADAGAADAGSSLVCDRMGSELRVPSDSQIGSLEGDGERDTQCGSSIARGPEDYYTFTLTERSVVSLRVLPTVPPSSMYGFAAHLAIRSSCDEMVAALACTRGTVTDVAVTPPPPHLQPVLDPGTYIVVVDAGDAERLTPDTYRIELDTWPPGTGGECSAPVALPAGSTLTGESLSASPTSLPRPCESWPSGQSRFYRTRVPAGSGVRIRVTPSGAASAFDPVLRLLSACDAASCLDSSDWGRTGAAEELTYVAPAGADRDVIIEVQSTRVVVDGTYDIAVEALDTANNAICAMATPLADGTVITGESTADAVDTFSACGLPNRALYYSATVPAGHTLFVRAEIPSSYRLDLALTNGCGSGVCLERATIYLRTPPQTVETLVWTNAGTVDEDVILMVGSPSTSSGTFDLEAAIRPPPVNAACSSALIVGDGTELDFERTSVGTDSLASRCLSSTTAPVLYYRVSVPAGQELAVTAVPYPDIVRAHVRLLASCGSGTCEASASSPSNGAPAVLTWRNTTASALERIVAVATGFGDSYASVQLELRP